MDNKKYTANDLAKYLDCDIRTAQRLIKNLTSKDRNTIIFKEDVFDLLVERYENDTEEITEELMYEGFTTVEYDMFKKWLTEYPLLHNHIKTLEKELEYHKKRYDELIRLHEQFIMMHNKTIDNISQRNYIEAKEKNIE